MSPASQSGSILIRDHLSLGFVSTLGLENSTRLYVPRLNGVGDLNEIQSRVDDSYPKFFDGNHRVPIRGEGVLEMLYLYHRPI